MMTLLLDIWRGILCEPALLAFAISCIVLTVLLFKPVVASVKWRMGFGALIFMSLIAISILGIVKLQQEPVHFLLRDFWGLLVYAAMSYIAMIVLMLQLHRKNISNILRGLIGTIAALGFISAVPFFILFVHCTSGDCL